MVPETLLVWINEPPLADDPWFTLPTKLIPTLDEISSSANVLIEIDEPEGLAIGPFCHVIAPLSAALIGKLPENAIPPFLIRNLEDVVVLS